VYADNFEIITTTDKAKRDQMFEDLRKNGDNLEKQVVKFSSNEMHVGIPNGKRTKSWYVSTWSIAYPRT
jgi:hypothetical protein